MSCVTRSYLSVTPHGTTRETPSSAARNEVHPMRLVRPGRLALTLGMASITATFALLPATPAAAVAGPPPSSMASMGDSISRGFNACGFYVDCTYRSFSTGDDGGVNSHYLRIRTKNSAMNGHSYND